MQKVVDIKVVRRNISFRQARRIRALPCPVEENPAEAVRRKGATFWIMGWSELFMFLDIYQMGRKVWTRRN